MIDGISHLTFIVRDLEKATEFFEYIFDAKRIYDSGEEQYSLSRERFFMVNHIWIAIMEGNALAAKSYNHVAFQVKEEELETYKRRIYKLGVEIKVPRKRVPGEGASLYFYDFDNHLFELHTGTLQERLHTYQGMEEAVKERHEHVK